MLLEHIDMGHHCTGTGRIPSCPQYNRRSGPAARNQEPYQQSNCTVHLFVLRPKPRPFYLPLSQHQPMFWFYHHPTNTPDQNTTTPNQNLTTPLEYNQPSDQLLKSRSIFNLSKEWNWMQLNTEIICNVRYRCIIFIYYDLFFLFSLVLIIRISEEKMLLLSKQS